MIREQEDQQKKLIEEKNKSRLIKKMEGEREKSSRKTTPLKRARRSPLTTKSNKVIVRNALMHVW